MSTDLTNACKDLQKAGDKCEAVAPGQVVEVGVGQPVAVFVEHDSERQQRDDEHDRCEEKPSNPCNETIQYCNALVNASKPVTTVIMTGVCNSLMFSFRYDGLLSNCMFPV